MRIKLNIVERIMNKDTIQFNTIRWADVGCSDLVQMKKFYGQLFGWSFKDIHHEGNMVYSIAYIAELGGYQDSSVVALAPRQNREQASKWELYVLVENLENTIDKLDNTEGRLVLPSMDVMDAGKMAACEDAQENRINLWQPTSHYGAQVLNEKNSMMWFELITNEIESVSKFLQSMFNWSVQHTSVDGEHYWFIWMEKVLIGGIHTKLNETGGKTGWIPYFKVDDIDKYIRNCEELGGTIVFGPKSVPDLGSYAIATDPESNIFGFTSYDCN